MFNARTVPVTVLSHLQLRKCYKYLLINGCTCLTRTPSISVWAAFLQLLKWFFLEYNMPTIFTDCTIFIFVSSELVHALKGKKKKAYVPPHDNSMVKELPWENRNTVWKISCIEWKSIVKPNGNSTVAPEFYCLRIMNTNCKYPPGDTERKQQTNGLRYIFNFVFYLVLVHQ